MLFELEGQVCHQLLRGQIVALSGGFGSNCPMGGDLFAEKNFSVFEQQ